MATSDRIKTPETELHDAIGEMFADWVDGPAQAYVESGPHVVPYVVFYNGHLKREGANDDHSVKRWDLTEVSIADMIERTKAAVSAHFPNHAKQTLVWRMWPTIELGRGLRGRFSVMRIRIAAIPPMEG